MARSELESLGICTDSAEEKLLKKYVDESSFSFEEWVEALKEFSEWLEENNRAYEARSALEYLHCCALSAEHQVLKTQLWKIVSQMLKDFGFEGRKYGSCGDD